MTLVQHNSQWHSQNKGLSDKRDKGNASGAILFSHPLPTHSLQFVGRGKGAQECT